MVKQAIEAAREPFDEIGQDGVNLTHASVMWSMKKLTCLIYLFHVQSSCVTSTDWDGTVSEKVKIHSFDGLPSSFTSIMSTNSNVKGVGADNEHARLNQQLEIACAFIAAEGIHVSDSTRGISKVEGENYLPTITDNCFANTWQIF